MIITLYHTRTFVKLDLKATIIISNTSGRVLRSRGLGRIGHPPAQDVIEELTENGWKEIYIAETS